VSKRRETGSCDDTGHDTEADGDREQADARQAWTAFVFAKLTRLEALDTMAFLVFCGRQRRAGQLWIPRRGWRPGGAALKESPWIRYGLAWSV